MRYALTTLGLAPVLLPQALWTRWRTPRLGEPEGPRRGTLGNGPPLGLLVAGDSAAAGVGAHRQDEALCGQLARRLAAHWTVTYRLEAATGDRTRQALVRLRGLEPQPFDAAVLSLGVNDVTGGTSLRTFLAQQRQLWSLLRERFGTRLIVVTGLPPVHRFPALPQPLRHHLGGRATAMTLALQALAREEAGCEYLDLRVSDDVSSMAGDGFHPGPPIYALWAEAAAAVIDNALAPSRLAGD